MYLQASFPSHDCDCCEQVFPLFLAILQLCEVYPNGSSAARGFRRWRPSPPRSFRVDQSLRVPLNLERGELDTNIEPSFLQR
jgi:hypothetical protein